MYSTRAVAKEMSARRETRYLGLHQRISCLSARDRLQIRRLLLCCGVLLAVSEHEADDELEAVAILRGKPRPQPRGPTTPDRAYLPHMGDFVGPPPKHRTR